MPSRGCAAALVAAGALGVAVAGCSAIGTPGATTTTASNLAQAQATHEYPSPPPPAETAVGGSSSPVEAIRAFANAYINWTADTVAEQMSKLAAQSIGQARSAMQLAAAGTAHDNELAQGGIANSGTIEAVAQLAGRRDDYLVVTREQTTATNTTAYQGLRPAWHLAIATVVRLTDRTWVLSRWQPES
jgi:hypothetical protein